MKLLLLLPSIAVIRGEVLPPSGDEAVRFIIVAVVPLVHTPVVVFAVHCPSIITLLIRFTGAEMLYVPLAIRITTGLLAVPPVARVRARGSEAGSVDFPDAPMPPVGEQYITPQAWPPDDCPTVNLMSTVASQPCSLAVAWNSRPG